MAFLLVDQLDENKQIGMTTNIEKVMHNLQIISVDYYNDFMKVLEDTDQNGHVEICTCGRYINIIQISKDKKKGNMIFIDTLNDYNRALDASIMVKNTYSNESVTVFMEQFQRLTSHYEQDYNAAELLLESGVILN